MNKASDIPKIDRSKITKKTDLYRTEPEFVRWKKMIDGQWVWLDEIDHIANRLAKGEELRVKMTVRNFRMLMTLRRRFEKANLTVRCQMLVKKSMMIWWASIKGR